MRLFTTLSLLTLLTAGLGAPAAHAGEGLCTEDRFCELPRWDMPGAGAFADAGRQVVVSGDVAAVAAPSQQAVHVHVLTYGVWEHVAMLVPPPGSSAGSFGRALAMTDQHIAVGSPTDDTDGAAAGAVFLYERTSVATWAFQEKLLAPVPADSSRFGAAVTGDGELLVVGQPEAAGGGSIHLYAPGAVAPYIDTIQQPGSTGYGAALDLAGELLVVGDEWDDEVAGAAGAVWVHVADATLGLSGGTKTTAFDGTLVDRFGSSVATDGKTVVVGAVGEKTNGSLSGAAYVYDLVPLEVPGELDFMTKLTACDPQPGDWFGVAVDVEDDRVLVGAYGADAVYVFERDEGAGIWGRDTVLRAGDGGVDTNFGFSLELTGDYVLVGAIDADGEVAQSGAVYHFSLANQELAGSPCPCDTLPVGVAYGDGKPGTLGVPYLEMLEPPVLGATTIVSLRDARPGAPVYLLVGLGTAAQPFDLGMLYVQEPIFVQLPPADATGRLDIPYTLSVNPIWCDVLIAHQVMVLDPEAIGPYGTAQTNGLLLVPGS